MWAELCRTNLHAQDGSYLLYVRFRRLRSFGLWQGYAAEKHTIQLRQESYVLSRSLKKQLYVLKSTQFFPHMSFLDAFNARGLCCWPANKGDFAQVCIAPGEQVHSCLYAVMLLNARVRTPKTACKLLCACLNSAVGEWTMAPVRNSRHTVIILLIHQAICFDTNIIF